MKPPSRRRDTSKIRGGLKLPPGGPGLGPRCHSLVLALVAHREPSSSQQEVVPGLERSLTCETLTGFSALLTWGALFFHPLFPLTYHGYVRVKLFWVLPPVW